MTSIDPLLPDVRRHRITRDDLRTFCASIGEKRPVHVSVRGARAAGHPDLLAPPTYLFGLTLRTGSPCAWATEQGMDMAHALHGEQSFDYSTLVFAGDAIELASTCEPMVTKGGWQRLRRTTEVHRGAILVATLTTTLLCAEDVA